MSFNEKWDFLTGPGGAKAALYFAVKLLAGIETFKCASIVVNGRPSATMPVGILYSVVRTRADVDALAPNVRALAETQSGRGVATLVENGGSLHLLLSDGELAAQLTIERGPDCTIGHPPVRLTIGEANAFLSYLYTWPDHRRKGLARLLIRTVTRELGGQGIERIFTHVRATNVPSLAAFERSGWSCRAMVMCTRSGRILLESGMREAGIGLVAGEG